jgi:hypothetical protein
MANPIRIAIGNIQSSILRDILTQLTRLETDMEVVGQIAHENLKDAISEQKADVLICDIRPEELPQVCRELFAEPASPIVVGLARDGHASVCIADAGVTQLISVIRTAINGAQDGDTKVVEIARATDADLDEAAALPYATNAECIDDHLHLLDLALLSEVDAFHATQWDEGIQRLQGLAISPEEVRALLAPDSAAPDSRQAIDLRRRRGRAALRTARRMAATKKRADAPPFVRLVERFGLNPLEAFCVIGAWAPELDRNKYGKAYALLQDDVTRKQPSLDLLLRLYGGAASSQRFDAARAFDPARPIRRWNLLRIVAREASEPASPLGRRVELDERLSHFLLGVDDLGAQLGDVAVLGTWDADALRPRPPADVEARLVQLIGDIRAGEPASPPRVVVHMYGRYGTGRRALVAGVCERAGLQLVRVDAGRLVTLPPQAFEDALSLLARETHLHAAALCVENIDSLLDEDGPAAQALKAIAQRLRDVAPVAFVIGHKAWVPASLFPDGVFQSVELEIPDVGESEAIWTDALAGVALDPAAGTAAGAAHEVASRFQLSAGQIHDALAAARTRATWRQPESAALTLDDLYRASREQCSHRLGVLARRVTTKFGWSDLILPPMQCSQLRELETAIRNASGVLEDWNFESRLQYGRGITALFSGPSGTGKTMAAGILSRELGLDLYKIDLSRVVSKFIGETEKNLDRIFEQAEDANAMLFFDEADALFGKRSAIKDAHDRYANIEIAYLLQKMEERRGVTILATNLKTNMDEAFARRIRFGIEFPMPEYTQRLQIWKGSLPQEAPLVDDVDLPMLANRLRVSGGSIVNVCVSAASLAYEPGGAIGMKHLLHAAKRELQKLGHQYNENDFRVSELAPAGRPQ